MSDSAKNALNVAMYLIAAFLMFIRIDWWWWGKKIGPFVFGWLSYPMLYQLLIWAVGWLVVIITCKYLWGGDELD